MDRPIRLIGHTPGEHEGRASVRAPEMMSHPRALPTEVASVTTPVRAADLSGSLADKHGLALSEDAAQSRTSRMAATSGVSAKSAAFHSPFPRSSQREKVDA
jgi:hypothetical protein